MPSPVLIDIDTRGTAATISPPVGPGAEHGVSGGHVSAVVWLMGEFLSAGRHWHHALHLPDPPAPLLSLAIG